MENPATWTPLHYELNDILKNKLHLDSPRIISELTSCLQNNGYETVTQTDVGEVFSKYIISFAANECGNSLPALLVFMAKSFKSLKDQVDK